MPPTSAVPMGSPRPHLTAVVLVALIEMVLVAPDAIPPALPPTVGTEIAYTPAVCARFWGNLLTLQARGILQVRRQRRSLGRSAKQDRLSECDGEAERESGTTFTIYRSRF